MSENSQALYAYTQNRELSWLRFNQRVLEEAADPSVPLLERLKFVSIFSSNLDEFFMIRVGSLFDISRMQPEVIDNKTGWNSQRQLERIYRRVRDLLFLKKQIYTALMDELKAEGIHERQMDELSSNDKKMVCSFFRQEMLPVLSPILLGPHHPVPHLIGLDLYAAALLDDVKGKQALGIVPVPKALPPYLILKNGRDYIRTENILLHWLPSLFASCTLRESCILRVTRNADISFDEEKFEDDEEGFRQQIKKLIKKRDLLEIVRMELSTPLSDPFRERLRKLVKIDPMQIFVDDCPLDLQYAFSLAGALSEDATKDLRYVPHRGRWAEDILQDQPIIPQIQEKDRLLYYPFDRVDPFLKLLNEAVEDPRVLSIKITIYRLASSSKIAQLLCRAAEKGIEVLVLIELRARFDEANNLSWSKMLEDSGCQVIYGMEGFKCHSKVCLITMKSRGKMTFITQIGTGNYNEQTNALYTDLSLMTADQSLGEDATIFFRNMLTNNLNGEYQRFAVSPQGIKQMILKHIDEQIALGRDGYVCIKANSVTERETIDKLAEASRAGVEIQLIIRGICCILPGVPGHTENIHVTSIVGRFLEHARVYQFGKNEEAKFYISSADLMTRNLNRRVEIAAPIDDPDLGRQLRWLLETQLKDTAKASFMMSDGRYCRKQSALPFDSQAAFISESPHHEAVKVVRKPGVFEEIADFFSKLFGR